MRGWHNGAWPNQYANCCLLVRQGNPGEIEALGDGVIEMKIHFGPGYRVYYVPRSGSAVDVLWGGDKSTQNRDIKHAKAMASALALKELRDGKRTRNKG